MLRLSSDHKKRSWDTSTFRRKDLKQRGLGLCRERKAATESAQTHPTPRYVDHARRAAALILIAEANFRSRKTDWVELNANTFRIGDSVGLENTTQVRIQTSPKKRRSRG